LVYNVIGAPRVVLSLNKGKFKELVFYTDYPQKVIEIVNQKVGETKGGEYEKPNTR